MTAPFPLSPVPSSYFCLLTSNAYRNNVFYEDGTPPTFIIASYGGHTAGETAYTVRDYFGDIVSSGAVSGPQSAFVPAAPVGGWRLGWYRLYFTGPTVDAVFGNSCGATCFAVIRNDPHFIPMPAAGTYGGAGGESRDMLMKGVLGIGTSRLTVANAANPSAAGADTLSVVQSDVAVGKTYWTNPGSQYLDPARPRYLFATFPNETTDKIVLPASSGNWLTVYCATEMLDGSQVFVTLAAGSVSGGKITVSYPNNSTVVETFDNLATNPTAAATTVNATSAYIKCFPLGGTSPGTMVATAIGHTYYTGVGTAVAALYPDVTRFEGPANEPNLGAECAHRMRLFQAAVHAGNAAAKAIGPCAFNIGPLLTSPSLTTSPWGTFLAAGGGNYCDEISFHAYNELRIGDLVTIPTFLAALASYGLSGKPLWQTEATQGSGVVNGVYAPRSSTQIPMEILLWEQYGIPRERNPVWYDKSHGFWAYPAWIENSDGSLNPAPVMLRVLAEETWGQTHHTKLDFGFIANNIFLGSLYQATDTSGTIVLMGMCVVSSNTLANAQITFTITGTTDPLTVVDCFGNTSTVTPDADGRVTVPMIDGPSYLRIPAGVTATPYSVNDWPAANQHGQGANSSPRSVSLENYSINDGLFQGVFNSGAGRYQSANSLPDTVTFTWKTATRLDRVVLWGTYPFATNSCLIDLDVQTSVDGTTWVTQATLTKPTPTSFLFGTDANGVGCSRETYWDQSFVQDIKLPAAVTCKAVRIYVRETSYGGRPDAACVTAAGFGNATQQITLTEMACLCDSNTHPQLVAA